VEGQTKLGRQELITHFTLPAFQAGSEKRPKL
jgi:hypothetical protein